MGRQQSTQGVQQQVREGGSGAYSVVSFVQVFPKSGGGQGASMRVCAVSVTAWERFPRYPFTTLTPLYGTPLYGTPLWLIRVMG